MLSTARFLAISLIATSAVSPKPTVAQTVESVIAANAPLTAEAINGAVLGDVDAIVTGATPEVPSVFGDEKPDAVVPSASIVRLQIELDRAGVSPGVIDGIDGGNLRKAVENFQLMHGFPVTGKVDENVASALDSGDSVVGSYVIAGDDVASVVGILPEDYGELAKLDSLGYQTVEEGIAEKFHMDVDFLRQLNLGSNFAEGQTIFVAAFGPNLGGQVTKVVVDKQGGQVRAYDANEVLIAAYPATIGSDSNPSPSGTHIVKTVVENPSYTYNPKLNFQQGTNDKVLTLPPGPNSPVGSVWIDLSEPTYGIHGTPEPDRIDKTGSHGCVRLTNWDARELGKMLKQGVPVIFLE